MKACIIGVQNLRHMTLMSLYTDFFEKNNVEYDLIYIDKYGIKEKNNACHVYKFNGTKKYFNTPLGKALKAYLYKKYVISTIDKNKYDFLVIWREETAFLLSRYLKKKYKGRYSVNIRDLWNLKNHLMTHGIKNAVNSAAFNTIASKGFLRYLPSAEYIMVHSANEKILFELEKNFIVKKHNEPIVIMYIGTIRFQEYCYKIIRAFNNDKRFELRFVGQGAEDIEKFSKENGFVNVSCGGGFDSHETAEVMQGCQIINCAFGTKKVAEQMLTPIRYYYALFCGLPVLTCEGTWINQEAKKSGIEISIPTDIDNCSNLADIVYDKYYEIVNKDILEKIDSSKKEILECKRVFENKLRENIL